MKLTYQHNFTGQENLVQREPADQQIPASLYCFNFCSVCAFGKRCRRSLARLSPTERFTETRLTISGREFTNVNGLGNEHLIALLQGHASFPLLRRTQLRRWLEDHRLLRTIALTFFINTDAQDRTNNATAVGKAIPV